MAPVIKTSPSPVAVKDAKIESNPRTGKEATVQVALFDVNEQFAGGGGIGSGPAPPGPE